jgi:hypothetical protein
MVEAKYVNNRWWILKMDKRQTAVLSVMFIVVGMMFVVPAMIERAQAIISATAHTNRCCFSIVRSHLNFGLWTVRPKLVSPTEIFWSTRGKTFPFPGTERGYVVTDVGPGHIVQVTFHFNSPSLPTLGNPNTCSIDPPVGICHIPRLGTVVTATYELSLTGANGGDASGDEDDNTDDTP